MGYTPSRRSFLGSAGALAGLSFAGAGPVSDKPGDLKLGVASYSLRKFSRKDAIAMIKRLGTLYVNIKDVHLSLKSTPEEIKTARTEFEDNGLRILGVGNVSFPKADDA